MKKKSLTTLLLSTVLLVAGCNNANNSDTSSKSEEVSLSINSSEEVSINFREDVKENVDEICLKELKASFDFFYETANTTNNSPAYGLIPDRYNTKNNSSSGFASIASVGYGLAMLPIGVEYGWITYEQGQERALKTLRTMVSAERVHGFFYHFLSMNTGKRWEKVELSIIDTAILVNGCLVAGRYFMGDCYKIAKTIYEDIEWDWYYDANLAKFYMGYHPEKGFSGYWEGYAEQLMLFVLAAGSPTYPVNEDPYNYMKYISRLADKTDAYDSFYMTWTGSIFTYQFSHAFIDFRDKKDEDGVNWFDNSINASKAAVEYAKSVSNKFKTCSEVSWGLTACDGPNGYTGAYGNFPCSGGNYNDGTIPPCGAIGSIVFTPEESIAAMKNFEKNEKLWSKYGFIDAYNLGFQDGFSMDGVNIGSNGWYASDVIGIDKGISGLMIENYISGMIWNITNEIPYYQKGLEVLNIK